MLTIVETVKDIYHKIKELNKRVSQTRQVAGNHNLLSNVHPDTDPDTVTLGDLIYGGAGPEWMRLPIADTDKVLTVKSGIPSWEDPQGGAGGGEFLDNFDDEDIHWAWTLYNIAGSKAITEQANGTLNVFCPSGTQCYWSGSSNSAPNAHVGVIGYPMIIETKITADFSQNDETAAGIAFCRNVSGTNTGVQLERRRRDGSSEYGLYVVRIGSAELGNVDPLTTLPIWLRMRISGYHRNRSTIYFDYSTDGNTWYNILSHTNSALYTSTYDMTAALFGRQTSIAYNEVDVDFEHFKMTLNPGPG